MCLDENIRRPEAFRRLKFVAGKFDLQSVWLVKVNRVHESAIALYEVDTTRAQAIRGQRKSCPRHIERQMFHAAGLPWRVSSGILSGLVGEYGQQPSVSGVEV